MKKLFYLFCLLSVISFIGCSNDDEPEVKKFSPDVENVLTSIQGTFSGEEYFLEQWFRTDKLTFSPFVARIENSNKSNKNYGKIERTDKAQTEKDRFGEYHVIPRHLPEREKVL